MCDSHSEERRAREEEEEREREERERIEREEAARRQVSSCNDARLHTVVGYTKKHRE